MGCYGSSKEAQRRDHFQSICLWEKAHLAASLSHGARWGFFTYQQCIKPFQLSRSLARNEMSPQWSKFVRLGDAVALDEKLRKFAGQSAHYHVNKAKPDRAGHQTVELVARLDRDNITFLLGLYPFDGDYFSSSEDMRSVDVAKWCCSLVQRASPNYPRPIVVNDCYYSTEAARDVYRKNNFLYIMAQKQGWMPGVEQLLKGALTHRGQYAYAWNKARGEVCCAHWQVGRSEKKTYTVSNAFNAKHGQDFDKKAPPAYSHSAQTSNDCDRFNQDMGLNWYPFRPSDEDSHWDPMFFSMACMNAVHAARYFRLTADGETFKQFMRRLGVHVLQTC